MTHFSCVDPLQVGNSFPEIYLEQMRANDELKEEGK